MFLAQGNNGDAFGVRTQDLSIRSPTLYHNATALPTGSAVPWSLKRLLVRVPIGHKDTIILPIPDQVHENSCACAYMI